MSGTDEHLYHPNILSRRFRENVLSEFQFLQSDYGCRITENSPILIVYVTSKTRVIVHQGFLDFLIEVDIELLEDSDSRISLSSIVNSRPSTLSQLGGTTAVTSEVVQRITRKMADRLKRFGDHFLLGDQKEFEALRSWEQPFLHSDHELFMYRQMRSEFDQAWQRRDLNKVYTEWKKIEGSGNSNISSLDRRKGEYAAKHSRKRLQ